MVKRKLVVVAMVLAMLACAGRTPLERGRSFSKEMMEFWWQWAKQTQSILDSEKYTETQKKFVREKIAPKVDEFGDAIDSFNDALEMAHSDTTVSVAEAREKVLELKTAIIKLFTEV